MADKHGGWLDRGAAERVLRGEPPATGDPVARERAERLAASLAALAAPVPPVGEELPGEAAALAAFRAARAERAGAAAGTDGRDAARTPPVRVRARDGGAARRARRPRPLRLGLAAVLAVGAVGGGAVAAGTGALSPFGGGPEPVSSAAVTPDHPVLSPSQSDVPRREDTDGSAPAPAGEDAPAAEDGGATGRDPGTGTEADPGSGAGGPADDGGAAR
ncbi:hypothetical protein NGM37_43315, partial [Streptomyces sp. TRM76130]|nr:hypothetical protein [Streptomyces sp. TRM76130]